MMQKCLAGLLLGFGMAMAVVVGERMTSDALAVVIGVGVGVAASVPVSLLLVALLRHERRPWGATDQPPAAGDEPEQLAQPAVIVIDSGRLARLKAEANALTDGRARQ